MKLTDKSFERLARGSYYLILDNLVNMVFGALFWIMLAKMVEPTSLGQTMVVVALVTSVIGFAGYGVQVTISKYISEYNTKGMQNTSRKVLRLGIMLALLVSGSVGISLALLSENISTIAYQNQSLSTLLTLAVLTFLPSQTVVSALMGAFQGAQRMKYVVLTDLAYQIVRIAVALALVLSGFDGFGILVGFAIASISASILGYTCFVPRAVPKSSKKEETNESLKHIMKFSGLNYFAVGMRTLSAQIGVMVLGTQNFEWAAFYGLSVLISNIVGGILLAVSRAMLPTASEEWIKGNKEKFKHLFNVAIRISLLISGFGFLVFMIEPSYVLNLISESYVEAASALRILVVAAVISSLGAVMVSILNAANRASEVAKIGLVSSAITIVLTFVLAPIIQLEGAAVAMLIGSIYSLVLSVIVLKRKEQMIPSMKSVLRPSISVLIAFFIGYTLFAFWNDVILSVALAISCYAGLSRISGVTTERELKLLFSIVTRTFRS
jgi:O-antigen/teichoic acid export membrane protein